MILQIVLWILKIIGWILLAVFGLFVLSVCLVLFTPLRYEGAAGCKGTKETLWARLKFSVLFRLVDGCVEYMDGKTTWRLRIAWKQLHDEEAKQVMEETVSVAEAVTKDWEEPAKPLEELSEPSEELSKLSEDTAKATEEQSTEKSENAKERRRKAPTVKQEQRAMGSEKRSFFERIEYTFQTFCDKMNVLIEKKEKIVGFLEDEIHHAALLKAIQSFKRLVIRLKPKTLLGNVRFGFEDPSVTGKVLAAISVIAPFFEGNLDVEPEFNEEVLEGKLLIAGKITAWKFAALALELVSDKNIRKTISHIKNFKL